MSPFWRRAFKLQYRLIAWLDPLIRVFWRRFGLGNTVDVQVLRRNGRGERSRLLGLLRAGGGLYLGHPNGDVGWTRDLEAAGGGLLRYPNGVEWRFTAARLPLGDEREQAIRSTGQHPFPGNLTYRLGRRHIRAVGVFFRIELAA